MFIVIDWIDGSWKWTQVALLEKKLLALGKKVKILDYPRYTKPSAFAVEKYLNWGYGANITAKQASIFYALDRFDDSFQMKEDSLEYDYIISNRYVSASMIHQAWKIAHKREREEFLDWLYDLEYNIFGIKKPDITIFLNVNPQTSRKLVLKKDDREYLTEGKKMDIHEEDLEHMGKAYQVALEVVQKYNWIQIDCEENNQMRSIEEINQNILDIIL